VGNSALIANPRLAAIREKKGEEKEKRKGKKKHNNVVKAK